VPVPNIWGVAPKKRLAYVMVGRIYKAARILSERDGVCVIALEDDRGNTWRFETARGVDPRSGLPTVLEHGTDRRLAA
jgi:hypothetical protein